MTDFSNWIVVIVDDELENIGVIELVLNFNNIQSYSVISGHDCLALIDNIPTPTVLLIDIQMPQMSGYELLQELRSHARWGTIPMIAVTAHALTEDRDKILNAGFDGYISKPISVMSFLDQVIDILNELER